MEDNLEAIEFYMDITFNPIIPLPRIHPTRMYIQGSIWVQPEVKMAEAFTGRVAVSLVTHRGEISPKLNYLHTIFFLTITLSLKAEIAKNFK